MAERIPMKIGDHTLAAPVVLAPMAGVTNAAFRSICRQHAPGLVYVNEMVMAAAIVHRNDKTMRMMSFAPDENPRSLQIYGSDPAQLGHAVSIVCEGGLVDHVDLNFGCPAAKVTRKGGGAAVPARPALLRAIFRAAVKAAEPFGIPVTAKFRMGLDDAFRTDRDAALICADEGAAWVAMHARTVEQHYSGDARWGAITQLKQLVVDAGHNIPVLGNGDIWEAQDALNMMNQTGCDGVVIGRGCLGWPWLFSDLVDAFAGREVPAPRTLGEVADGMLSHARALVEHYSADVMMKKGKRLDGENFAMRDFRKHASWYLTGYPVGPEVRRRFSLVATIAELEQLLAELDRSAQIVEGGARIRRGHTNGPIKVALPVGFLTADDANSDMTIPDDAREMAISGG
ncbi:MAG: tRNA dihydrouridine synthase DusB [Actinomycetota bacterium]|nr:tRNA dihydrouridine synthase DusB [Actinomycetota bacterium]